MAGRKKSEHKEHLFRYWTFVLILAAFLVLLNILARISTVCNWYTDHVFGWWSESLGRLMGLIPVSVGEIAIYVAVGLVALCVLMLVGMIFWGRHKKYRHRFAGYLRFLLAFVLIVGIVLTLNLSFLYKTDHLNVKEHEEKEYTTGELEILRNYIVEQCNTLSEEMMRDDAGDVVFGGTKETSKAEILYDVRKALQNEAADYPRLAGYYPPVKELFSSRIMYDIGTIGVYFPHTMEANMSALVDAMWYPYTAAHELTHLKGYIYEDEANFLAYLALMNTDNDYLRYSAYLNVLNHVNNNYYDNVDKEHYQEQTSVSNLVWHDDASYTAATTEKMETATKDNIVDTQVITTISEQMTKEYLDYYNSTANYDEVTRLLLEYYDGILY